MIKPTGYEKILIVSLQDMGRITIKQLAERLNLSISSVSRALNDSYEISPETRARVKTAASEMNYRPNSHASSLRSQKSRIIGVIIPEITNSFFALAINGIEEIAQENGYHVLIHITHDNRLKEEEIIKHLLNGRVDGILMSVASQTADTSHIGLIKEMKIPVVFFDRVCDDYATKKIMTDDFNSGYNAVSHLVSKSCTNLAFLSLPGNRSIDQKRKEGFIMACRDHGVTGTVTACTQDDDENQAAISRLLTAERPPDGIFASVEKLALTLYEVCNNLEIVIPQQLKVISFSNLKIASLMQPPLTTITQPAFEMGREAARSLFSALKNNLPAIEDEEQIIPSQLIERRSTQQ